MCGLPGHTYDVCLVVFGKSGVTFITPFGAFCYTSMPFGLWNIGATFQRCMQRCFREQIGRNLEVYVDDIVI